MSVCVQVCKCACVRVRARPSLTACYDPLQPDNVRVIKLAHDRGLCQELPPLFVGVACLQRLDGYTHFLLAGQLESTAAHLSELTLHTGERDMK